MAWQRSIPFGYRMEQAKIVCEKTEAEAVKQIFSMYLNGQSLAQIAAEMTMEGPQYHDHANVWNKSMVKRILDNPRYLGDEGWPRLINTEDFMAAGLMKAAKHQAVKPFPEDLRPLSKITVCAVCGTKMERNPSSRKKTRWVCQNGECRETAILEDDEYREGVQRCLHRMQPTVPSAVDNTDRRIEVLRMENELTAAFNRGTESTAYMKTLIFAVAAEKYRALPDLSNQHRLNDLRATNNETDLRAVRHVLLRRGGDIAVELITGDIITYGEEAKP